MRNARTAPRNVLHGPVRATVGRLLFVIERCHTFARATYVTAIFCTPNIANGFFFLRGQ